jgi:uncharacterized YccA/Bax inhibitor family protein
MSNPLLNDKAMNQAANRGWAAGEADAGKTTGTQTGGTWAPPINDGPVSPWTGGERMTASGAMTASMVMLVLLVAAAVFGWSMVDEPRVGAVQFPGWIFVAAIVGFICAIVPAFKPQLARFLAPVYAIAQGVFVGAISHAYNIEYDGIVVQAIGATLAVFGVMLVLYRTGVIKVTDKFRRVVLGAMLGLLAFYLVSFLFSIFGGTVSFFESGSLLGIGISVFAAGLAALNLAMDFDFIERGEREGLPKAMEWYAALGLMVTLVWLYLEMLRLLAHLRDR